MIKCAIIDDNPLALEIIESYLSKLDDAQNVFSSSKPIEALNKLTNEKIDLVFLDIQMPNLTGLELIRTLQNPPQVIFTTAYSEYAVDGFDLNATDYLVKPIPLNRFLTAFNKAKEQIELKKYYKDSSGNGVKQDKYIFVKSEYDNVKIKVEDILYIEGLGEYIKIIIKDSKTHILTLMNFTSILEKLSSSNFLRVHRSFIVNIDHIDTMQKTKIAIGSKKIPIGETYKLKVLDRLGL